MVRLLSRVAWLGAGASASLSTEPAGKLASELITLVRRENGDIATPGGPLHRLPSREEEVDVPAEGRPYRLDRPQGGITGIHDRDRDHGLGWVDALDSVRAHREPDRPSAEGRR